eukprot:3332981-Prymnesium_polylepis.1
MYRLSSGICFATSHLPRSREIYTTHDATREPADEASARSIGSWEASDGAHEGLRSGDSARLSQ